MISSPTSFSSFFLNFIPAIFIIFHQQRICSASSSSSLSTLFGADDFASRQKDVQKRFSPLQSHSILPAPSALSWPMHQLHNHYPHYHQHQDHHYRHQQRQQSKGVL